MSPVTVAPTFFILFFPKFQPFGMCTQHDTTFAKSEPKSKRCAAVTPHSSKAPPQLSRSRGRFVIIFYCCCSVECFVCCEPQQWGPRSRLPVNSEGKDHERVQHLWLDASIRLLDTRTQKTGQNRRTDGRTDGTDGRLADSGQQQWHDSGTRHAET